MFKEMFVSDSSEVSLRPVMTGEEARDFLGRAKAEEAAVRLVYAGRLCALSWADEEHGELHQVDLTQVIKTDLGRLASKGLVSHLELSEKDFVDATHCDGDWSFSETTADSLNWVYGQREQLLGRGADIARDTAWKVWADAGGCCMYEGCGKDLSEIALHTKPARISYLAHIIASSPRGPRGDSERSHQLSNVADNIMLMCDEHHRLIDRVAEADHSVERLNEMRSRHVSIVRRLRTALTYTSITAISLLADLGGIPANARDTDLSEALLPLRRTMRNRLDLIRRTQRDDRTEPGFWARLLHEHEPDIRHMISSLSSRAENITTQELAIFPIHLTPILALSGRIVGEARPVHVFQFDRQRKSWQWPADASPLPAETFEVTANESSQAEEVFLSLELTAQIDSHAIPEAIRQRVEAGDMPWFRISIPEPSSGCIQHPDDLEQFREVARRVVARIQDEVRATKVHLIAIAPASTVFSFGQMLQAGHHSTYTVYDRPSGASQFRAALSIGGHSVSSADQASSPYTLDLR